LIIDLRHGAHQLLGVSNLLMDHVYPGQPFRLMPRLSAVIEEALADPPPLIFQLSNGARLLQEFFGPASPHAQSQFFLTRIRELCVVLTCLERVGAEHYRTQPIQPQNPPRPKHEKSPVHGKRGKPADRRGGGTPAVVGQRVPDAKPAARRDSDADRNADAAAEASAG
jgi:hypothetical protein